MLVAKGFHQTSGIHYNETFNPIVKHTNIRIFLIIALFWRKLDVDNAFLSEELDKEVCN